MPEAELSNDGTKIIVKTFYSDHDQIIKVPGSSWNKNEDAWRIPASWPACLILRDVFGDRLQVGPRLAEQSHAWKAVADWREWLSTITDISQVPQQDWLASFREALPNGLYGFQGAGALWMGLMSGSLLADDPGTGKTIQSIAEMIMLEKAGIDVRPALVVCPNSVMSVWQSEIEKWAPHWGARIVTGGAARRREILSQPSDVFIINWQTLRMHTRLAPYGDIRLKRCPDCGGESQPGSDEPIIKPSQCEVHLKELNMIPFQLVIADEAHRLANPKSKQTRAAWWMMWHAPRRIAATGTPTEGDISDMWPILHGVDKDAFPTKTKFVDMFASTSPSFWGGFEVLGLKPEKKELYHRVTAPYMRRMQKQIVLPQLPEIVHQYRYPEMHPSQAKIYKQMKDDMIAHLEQMVVAPNPLAQANRLALFAAASAKVTTETCTRCENPFWPDMDCPICKGTGQRQIIDLIEPSSKVDDLLEFIEDEGLRPLVVASESRRLIELVERRLVKEKIGYVSLTGKTPQTERPALITAFQNGRVPIFLMTNATGGEGITLTRSDTVFRMFKSFSARTNKQVQDRVHRIGSETHTSVRVIDQVAPGTVDERKEDILDGKHGRIEEIVRDKERLRWLLGD